MKAIFSIDFDGTIAKEIWPDIGELLPGAAEAIREIKSLGHTIIINTCREGKLLQDALEFLDKNGIPYDYANENVPEQIARYGDCRKIGGHVFVDDRNIGKWNWIDVLEKARRLAWS